MKRIQSAGLVNRLVRLSVSLASGLASVSLAGPAAAHQEAYVIGEGDRYVHVIDMATGLEHVGRTFRTSADAQGATMGDDGTLYVAGQNKGTLHPPANRAARIDLTFDRSQAGITSADVALSSAQDTLYVLQFASLSTGAASLIEVSLSNPRVQDCVANAIKDCYLGPADSTFHSLPITHPRFLATSSLTGELFAVGDTGAVAVFRPGPGSAALLPLPSPPPTDDPGGMAAGPDGRIAIAGNGPGGASLTLITPGSPARVETIPLPLSEAGGVRFDPRRRPDGYAVWVGDANGSRMVEVLGGRAGTPVPLGGAGANPIDLVVNHRGVVVTANENDTYTTVFPGSKTTRALGEALIAVELDRPREDPHVSASPFEHAWTYRTLYTYLGAKRFEVRNIGGGTLNVSSLSVTGFDRANFDIVRESCTGSSLAANATCTVDVDFRAGGYAGWRLNDHTYRANLRIDSNDDPLNLALTGEHFSTRLELKVKLDPPKYDFEFRGD